MGGGGREGEEWENAGGESSRGERKRYGKGQRHKGEVNTKWYGRVSSFKFLADCFSIADPSFATRWRADGRPSAAPSQQTDAAARILDHEPEASPGDGGAAGQREELHREDAHPISQLDW